MKALQIIVELLDGTPHGVRRSKIQHRPARAVAVPRDQISRIAEFDEFKKPGIYFLLGSVPAGPTIYVGQTDTLSDRLRTHRSRQDWTELVAVTSSDDWMNIAHTRCLESRCWANCQENRYFVLNSQEPKESQVSAQDQQLLEEFFEHMICLTRSLGYDFLSLSSESSSNRQAPVRQKPVGKLDKQPVKKPSVLKARTLNTPQPRKAMVLQTEFSDVPIRCVRCQNSIATLRCYPDRYVLEPGCLLRPLRPSAEKWDATTARLREKHLKEGKLKETARGILLMKEIEFSSPSGASSYLLGGRSNGWTDWQDDQGTALTHSRERLTGKPTSKS